MLSYLICNLFICGEINLPTYLPINQFEMMQIVQERISNSCFAPFDRFMYYFKDLCTENA